MKKTPIPELSVFEQIKAGLQDTILFSRGKLSLRTTVLPSPPPKMAPADIVRVRRHLNMSQAYFAAVLNVSTRTVQSWEQGIRRPSDASLRLLQVVDKAPHAIGAILSPLPFSRTREGRRRTQYSSRDEKAPNKSGGRAKSQLSNTKKQE